MSLDFSKLDFAVSFNPLSAFPLDARSYFESYDAALAAASSAKEVGDTSTTYYYGQTLVVVENDIAKLYMIQPGGILAPIEGGNTGGGEGFTLVVDKKAFVVSGDGTLKLKGLDDATPGMVATVGADGVITWTTPIDAYTKAETDQKIAAAAHLKRKIVTSIADIETYIENNTDAEQYIFMVPRDDGDDADSNYYDEYLVVTIADSQVIEQVGSWQVNLDDYATTKYVQDNFVAKDGDSRLITAEEAQKLFDIQDVNAEKNIINSISSDFTIVTDESHDRELQLNTLAMNKIAGLTDALAALKSSIEDQADYLITGTEREKLEKLNLVADGETTRLSYSADHIDDLAQWLSDHASTTKGLSEENFSTALKEKLTAAITIDDVLITSVDESQLAVNNGQLSIIEVDQSKVTGLIDALNAKASQESLNSAIETIETTLNNYVLKATYDVDMNNIQTDISDLKQRLTWQNI